MRCSTLKCLKQMRIIAMHFEAILQQISIAKKHFHKNKYFFLP